MAGSRRCCQLPCSAVPEFSNPDTTIPLLIIGGCLLLMLLTWFLTRGSVARRNSTPAVEVAAPLPIVGQTKVT